MTKAFHQQGIKVYIDVVYNHTGEGGAGKDPTIARLHSFRGLDNAAYYELAEKRQFYFDSNGLKDITWLRDTGTEADGGYMDNAENHFLAYRLDGTELGDSAHSLYVAYNGWSGEVTATLPANSTGKRWFRAADTDQWMENQDNFKAPGAEDLLNDPKYKLNARSVLVLIEK